MLLGMGKVVGAGLASIGLGGAGVGVGNILGSLILGIAVNPNVEYSITQISVLGFALTEAIALFSLMMSFLILFGG
jgi:F0F1-type ATP synthase membrane subunit c/vacuolar-type H+-ATPase subunit K